jgi:hypothetical protein
MTKNDRELQECNCDNCTPCTCIHQDFLIGCESVSIDLAGRCPGPVYGVHEMKISKIPSSNNEMQKRTCPKSIQCRFKGVGLFEWSFDHGSPTKDPKYNRQPLTVTNMQGSQVSFFATSWTLPSMSTNLPFWMEQTWANLWKVCSHVASGKKAATQWRMMRPNTCTQRPHRDHTNSTECQGVPRSALLCLAVALSWPYHLVSWLRPQSTAKC